MNGGMRNGSSLYRSAHISPEPWNETPFEQSFLGPPSARGIEIDQESNFSALVGGDGNSILI
jgi:hypothetical protein